MAQIPGSPRINQYVASAGQTVFIYSYEVYTDVEIIVSVNDTDLILTTDYTVQDAGNPSGGTITLVVPAALDDVITLVGNTLIERETTFTNGGDFLASAINGEYDRLDVITNELVTTTDSVFKLKTPSVIVSTDVPAPEAGKCLKWNATADALEISTYDPDDSQGSAEAAAASAAAALASAIAADASAVEAEYWANTINLESVGVDITPDIDNAHDLGTPAKNWAELHTVDAYVYDDLEVGDDINVDGNIFVKTGIVDTQGIYVGTFPEWDFEVSTLGKTIVGTHGLEVEGSALVSTDLEVSGNAVVDGTLTVGGIPIGAPLKTNVSYKKDYNIGGGTTTANTWQTRPLNTTVYDDIGITLAGNEISLPAGTYDISIDVNTYNSGRLALVLYETGVGTIYDWTGGTIGGSAGFVHTETRFTLATAGSIYVTQNCSISEPNYGMGSPHFVAGHSNVYMNIVLEKV